MYHIPVYSLRLHLDKSVPFPRICLYDTKDQVDVINQALDLANWDKEGIGILALDSGYEVQGVHLMSIGQSDYSIYQIRELIKAAILTNATMLVMFHNHPNNHLEPSAADIAITKHTRKACRWMGIEMIDHVILSHDGHLSLEKTGWLEDDLKIELFHGNKTSMDFFKDMLKRKTETIDLILN